MPRKQHDYHYIYKTTCSVTNKFYIGMHSTSNLDDDYLGSGKILWYSIHKHGSETHNREILEFLDNRILLRAREKEIVNEMTLQDPLCMNLMVGGEGGFSKEQCAKGTQSMLKSLWNNENFRKEHSIRKTEMNKRLHKEGKMKAPSWEGKKHNEESINKMRNRKAQVGNKNSQFGKKWIHSIELKKTMSVNKEKLSEYLSLGWIIGRKFFKD